MPDAEGSRMSRHQFSIAYDGKDRSDDHAIDVQALAPALLAIGKLVREANAEFNGKRASAKVLVVSDFEHKCFNINFEVALSFYEQIKTFLGDDNVKTAKEVLEWIGLLASVSSPYLAYLQFLKWKRGRRVTEATTITDRSGVGVVEVKVEGDNNSVFVQSPVYRLSENPTALRATRDAFLPLGQDGFDTVRISSDGTTIDEIDNSDVSDIVSSCTVGIDSAKEVEPEVENTPAWLSVYSPVYDEKSDKWRFRLGKEIIYADISETTIAEEAIAREASWWMTPTKLNFKLL
jgi:hypothetical protein